MLLAPYIMQSFYIFITVPFWTHVFNIVHHFLEKAPPGVNVQLKLPLQ